jgi:Large ribosomal RNA subunit accumulation protein YceD
MRERRPNNPPPWLVPVAVEDIAENGRHFDLKADADVRAEVARMAGLRDLPRLEANFDVARHGVGGLHVVGRVSATVGQTCVVTLEPLANEVEEDIDVRFAPQSIPAPSPGEAEPQREARNVKWDDPEPLIGGVVDLGALAAEFLILGLDPYPRKSGAVFESPQVEEPDAGPFAALASLTRGPDGD